MNYNRAASDSVAVCRGRMLQASDLANIGNNDCYVTKILNNNHNILFLTFVLQIVS